jgi:hypothetical protein
MLEWIDLFILRTDKKENELNISDRRASKIGHRFKNILDFMSFIVSKLTFLIIS